MFTHRQKHNQFYFSYCSLSILSFRSIIIVHKSCSSVCVRLSSHSSIHTNLCSIETIQMCENKWIILNKKTFISFLKRWRERFFYAKSAHTQMEGEKLIILKWWWLFWFIADNGKMINYFYGFNFCSWKVLLFTFTLCEIILMIKFCYVQGKSFSRETNFAIILSVWVLFIKNKIYKLLAAMMRIFMKIDSRVTSWARKGR
jgi:hypothetical protein